jgi:hypothetical protein
MILSQKISYFEIIFLVILDQMSKEFGIIIKISKFLVLDGEAI